MRTKTRKTRKMAAVAPRGTIVVYKNVGTLSPKKVDAHMVKLKAEMREWTDTCKSVGWSILFIPVRARETSIEQLLF